MSRVINEFENLILIKNSRTYEFDDKTSQIDWIKRDKNNTENYIIKFLTNEREYNYHKENVVILSSPTKIDMKEFMIFHKGSMLRNIEVAYIFDKYTKVFYKDNSKGVFSNSALIIDRSVLQDDDVKNVMEYLKSVLRIGSNKSDVSKVMLKEFENIDYLSNRTVLSTYLKGESIIDIKDEELIIFPFGINHSQKEAVEKVFNNRISIIKGPPGTGKTQTILNIIANVIYRNKTVAIVSGNNSATDNVYEKLSKYGYGFLAAPLGNRDNQNKFFETIKLNEFKSSNWNVDNDTLEVLKSEILASLRLLDISLKNQNRRAKLIDKRKCLITEKKHFQNRRNIKPLDVKNYVLLTPWSSKRILEFIAELEEMEMKKKDLGIMDRVSLFLRYGFKKFRISLEELTLLIPAMHSYYYDKAINECDNQINKIESSFKELDFDKTMERFGEKSEALMKHLINERLNKCNKDFSQDNFKKQFKDFITRYPIILSTTNSIRNSIGRKFLFDYLIIDEASQVDLVTASLAMSCCKNIVIVGDPMQLSHIVDKELQEINNKLLAEHKVSGQYDYSRLNIIESLEEVYGEKLPRTLLKEHYRCHPKIIRFCNQKYYNDQLVVMTEDKNEKEVLSIYRTSPGNHERYASGGGYINLRQIEVIRDEVLPKIDCNNEEIGIITPYRKQAELAYEKLGKSIFSETVHKFQGREKKAIILSTVNKEPKDFSDDRKMINVAVSRAVSKLVLVLANDFSSNHGSHIGDLEKYILYTEGDASDYESQKISIFDCLYEEYSRLLIPLLKKMENISEYKSENLMYTLIKRTLKQERYKSLKVAVHVPLSYIVLEQEKFNDREIEFLNNHFTHVDFVIFNRLNKEPILAIEVDGYGYHDMNNKQMIRDKIKDKILSESKIPLIRFSTIESDEVERLQKALDDAMMCCKDIDTN